MDCFDTSHFTEGDAALAQMIRRQRWVRRPCAEGINAELAKRKITVIRVEGPMAYYFYTAYPASLICRCSTALWKSFFEPEPKKKCTLLSLPSPR